MVKVTVEPVPVALPVALVGLPPVTVAVTPPTFTVSAELAAKPWATMVALDPTVPLVGVRPVAEAVTVKVAEALSVPESVAVMVFAPAVLLGTVKVADQVPLAATVWVVMVRAEPAKVTLAVATVLPAV